MTLNAPTTFWLFFCSIYYGSQDGEVFSSIQYFELPRYFLFNLDISYGSFRTIIIRRDIGMIKECKDMILIFRDSLLKRDHCFPFMSMLSTCFTIPFLPKTACAWRPVLIFRRWHRAIVTVLFSCVTRQLSFKNIDFCYQSANFLRLHQNDPLQFFDDNLIRCFHNLYYKTNPEIQYIKERNRLFIKY